MRTRLSPSAREGGWGNENPAGVGISFVLRGAVCWMLFLLATCSGSAQLRSIDGVIGGAYDQQTYSALGSKSVFSHFRQLANLSVNGSVYRRNFADYTFRMRMLNTNSTFTNGPQQYDQHDLYFSYYDLTVDALQKTRFPASIFLRRDLTTNELSGDQASLNNKLLSAGGGGRISYAGTAFIPHIALGYDTYRSESVNPLLPLDESDRNIQLTLDRPLSATTSVSVDLLEHNRQDNIGNRGYLSRELHFRGQSQPSQEHQINTSVNILRESEVTNIAGTGTWNIQSPSGYNNQLNLQYNGLSAASVHNVESGLQDQLTLIFPPTMTVTAIAGHSIGSVSSPAENYPLSSSDLSLGGTYRGELDHVAPTVAMQAGYRRAQALLTQTTLNGIFTTGLQTRGFSLGQVFISHQIAITSLQAVTNQTLAENTLTGTVESNAINRVFIHANISYRTTKPMGGSQGVDRQDLSSMTNVTYYWSWVFGMAVTGSLTVDQVSSDYFVSKLTRTMIEVSIPDLMHNVDVRGNIQNVRDAFRNTNEHRYEAILNYHWKALTFGAHWIRYSFLLFDRDELSLTVSRPFRFGFE